MPGTRPPTREEAVEFGRKVRAYCVHIYTASGVVFAFLAAAEISNSVTDPRWVFGWLAIAGFVDATDGPLARYWNVKELAPRIWGRTIDDLVDYLNFTFLPLLLVWEMGWLPAPAALWVVLAMVFSLMGFANTAAKQEEDGFFMGFPSYWNVVAYYTGLLAVAYPPYGAYIATGAIVVLAVLTVLPVRFIYPNHAPQPWRAIVIVGAALWMGLLLALLPTYPQLPGWGDKHWLIALAFVYPIFYFGLSLFLDRADRKRQKAAAENRATTRPEAALPDSH